MSRNLASDVNRREAWAWAMYDFANSGYTTIVITAIFNAYFVSVIASNAPWATLVWTLSLALSYALVMLTAPLLGAYADAYAAKKRLLLFTTAGCVLFTAALYFAGPGSLWLAIPLIVLSNYFYGSGENLIAAFLPELAREESIGRVSGWGWSLGYVGGLVSLGVCLGYVSWAQGRGDTAADFVPVTMLITAVLFATASLPTFLMLKERAQPQPHLVGKNMVQESFLRLVQTIRHAREYQDLRRFLICTVFYQAGIQTVITLAAIYAQQVMHFTMQQTLMLIFVVNITAAIGAFSFGYLQDRIGHIPAISLTLVGWMIMVVMAWAAEGEGLFWAAANLAGLCMGASQSAGRALVGLFSPVTRRAEFFGLWGLAVKLSAIVGPVTYGLVSWVTQGDHRLAILITGVFFLIGLLILLGVDADRGREAALKGGT
ncbi:MAG: MFS transporter [Gallionella sp.]